MAYDEMAGVSCVRIDGLGDDRCTWAFRYPSSPYSLPPAKHFLWRCALPRGHDGEHARRIEGAQVPYPAQAVILSEYDLGPYYFPAGSFDGCGMALEVCRVSETDYDRFLVHCSLLKDHDGPHAFDWSNR